VGFVDDDAESKLAEDMHHTGISGANWIFNWMFRARIGNSPGPT
jgi:hypothetical protein